MSMKLLSCSVAIVLCMATLGCRCDGRKEHLPGTASTPPPPPPPPEAKPAQRELAEKLAQSSAAVAAAQACARSPRMKVEDLAVCIAAGGPPVNASGAGGAAVAAAAAAGAGAGGTGGSSAASAPSADYEKAVADAGTRFTQAAGSSPPGSPPYVAASAELDEDLKKAQHDELMRKAAEVAGPGKTSPPQPPPADADGKSGADKGGDGQVGQMLTMLLAAGCMAYTGSIQGCAIGAQFLSSLFGEMDGGKVDVERARRISEGASDLAEGKCDARCLGGLYEDSGAKAELERAVDEEISKRLGPDVKARAREGFRIFGCVTGIKKRGTAAIAELERCGLPKSAATEAAKLVSNCVETSANDAASRRKCVDEVARCITVQGNKTSWSCAP